VPHPFHADWATKALEAGKAVLCEKPLTVNAAEARRVVEVARRTGKFLMEAMTTRFAPSMVRARELVSQGALGDVRFVVADMGGRESNDPTSRWSSPALGGGSLLEMGVYPVAFAHNFIGKPNRIHATAVMAPTGVDRSCVIALQSASGAHAMLGCTLEATTMSAACVAGTDARIEFDGRMNCPQGARFMVGREIVEQLPVIPHAERMRFETLEVMNCLKSGLLESPKLPHDETVSIIETLDEIRRQIGVRYPFERAEEGPPL
jgi:predicted dehydrogenase